MEKKQTITSINDKVISKITFKYPELMAPNAEKLIRKEYKELIELKEKLSSARDKVRVLEKELKEKEDIFRSKQEWFTLEFETKTKEYITRECGIVHNGDLVYQYS